MLFVFDYPNSCKSKDWNGIQIEKVVLLLLYYFMQKYTFTHCWFIFKFL